MRSLIRGMHSVLETLHIDMNMLAYALSAGFYQTGLHLRWDLKDCWKSMKSDRIFHLC